MDKYTDEQIIKMFTQLAEELGKTPSQKDVINERKINSNFISNSIIQRTFGGLNKLSTLCGLKPNVTIISDKELIQKLKDFYDKNDFIPLTKNFKDYDTLPPVHLYDSRFKGVVNALGIAKIPLNKTQLEQKNRNKLSNKEMIDQFIIFYKENEFIPNQNDLIKFGLPPISIITCRFKNYKTFILACGINVDKETARFSQNRDKTDEQLLQYIRDYYKNVAFPIEREFKTSNGLPSYALYFIRFGTFKNAILIAGIDIPEERLRFFDREKLTDEEMLYLLKYYTNEKLKNNIYLLTNDEIDSIKAMPHSSTYNTRLEGVVKSYKKIDIDYYEFNKIALEKDMKEKYIELAEKLGHVPNSREIDKSSNIGECYSMGTYIEHFGLLSQFQKDMGHIPTRLGHSISKNDALDGLKRLGDKLNYTPTIIDVNVCPYLPSSNYYRESFGSFADSLKIAGFDNVTIYVSPKGNKALSLIEYKFLLMLENKAIPFEKEEYYRKYIDGFKRNFRLDFTIMYNDKKYLIEIFGIVGNDKYDERKAEKIKLCKENNLPLIEIYYSDFYKADEDKLHNLLLNKIDELNDRL